MLARGTQLPRKCLSRGLHLHNTPIADARWPGWHVVIGVEVHAQINSREKLFSSIYAAFSVRRGSF
jgi:hypothetical protein